MKNLLNSAMHCNGKAIALIYSIAVIGFLFTACKKEEVNEPVPEILGNNAQNSDATVLGSYTGLPAQTMWELQQARAASARYRNFNNAIKDGYVDINVIVPEMGHHYLKSAHLDANFDYRKPEILVYKRHEDGTMELVAVEYAVPIEASPNAAPAGFTGSHDEWDKNTFFGLWLLHAWVWSYNPNGVFNPTNPLVHTH